MLFYKTATDIYHQKKLISK